MADWGSLAKQHGVDSKNQKDSLHRSSDKSPVTLSSEDALDRAKQKVLSAAALAEKVKAKFKKEGDFEGGGIGDSVAGKLGSCASDLGLEQTQAVTQSIGIGPGSSSSSDTEEAD